MLGDGRTVHRGEQLPVVDCPARKDIVLTGEEVAGSTQRIADLIMKGPAAASRIVAEILFRQGRNGKGRAQGAQPAEGTGIHQILGRGMLGMLQVHDVFVEQATMPGGSVVHAHDRGSVEPEGFFAEDMFPRDQSPNRPLFMEMVREGEVDQVDIGPVQQLVIVKNFGAEIAKPFLGGIAIAGTDRDQLRPL